MSLPTSLRDAVLALEAADRRNVKGITIHRDLLEVLLNGQELLTAAMTEAFNRLDQEAQNAQ